MPGNQGIQAAAKGEEAMMGMSWICRFCGYSVKDDNGGTCPACGSPRK
jgi:rubrerythrin